MSVFRRKSIASLQAEALSDHSLKRALGALNLTTLGIGAIIGTGIFVLTGTVAAQNAGPAVILSFVAAAVVSIFAALCYSEFASLVPMAGSAYTYSYATLGEFVAWIIGWNLILEYAVGAITVAIGWSGYVMSFLRALGIDFPAQFSAARGTDLINLTDTVAKTLNHRPGWSAFLPLQDAILKAGIDPSSMNHVTAIFNVPAVIIVFIVTVLLVVGIKESANFNSAIVIIKIAVVLLFIGGAVWAINPANWHPFIPPNTGKPENFGWNGVLAGGGIVFFAYIGFDAVSTAAQEAKNPQRDLPIGIIGSLLICTILYILVAGIAVGVVPYKQLDVPDPIALVADHAGMGWMSWLIRLGAIAGLSSVILVMMLGQSRVFYSMARDGLLPPFISQVHPRFQTPWLGTILTGICVSIFSAVLSVRDAGTLCSIGTLLAFVVVSLGVMVLRLREPNLPRKFKTPMIWFVAPMGALSAGLLLYKLPWPIWRVQIVGGYMAAGVIFYFAYSVWHSKLARTAASPTTASALTK
jgi:APA family basic amino acid/polyamine antiporter